jgi:PAS domain S-box-containing protein
MKAVTPGINKKIEPENSQVLLNSIINSTTDMIWSVDPKDFGLTMFNRGLSDYFLDERGMTIKTGMRPEDLFPTDEFVQRWRGFYKQALKKGSFRTEYNTFSATDMLDLNIHVIKQDDRVIGLSVFGRNITKQKQAEKTLLETKKYWQSLVESTTDMVTVLDTAANILYQNPAIEHILGYSPDEIIGKNASGFAHLEDWPRCWDIFTTYVSSPKLKSPTVELRLRHKAGSWRTMETTGEVNTDETGQLVAVLTSRDVTERKRVEEELKQSEEKFRLLTESSVAGIYVIQDAKMAYVNPSCAKVFGYSPEEIIGRLSLNGLIHPDDIQAVMRRLQERLEGKTEESNIDYKGIKKDGSIINIEVYGMAINFQGRPAVMGTLLDITERKRVEEELNYQAALFANVNDAIVASDSQFRMTAFNPAAEALYGWKAEEVIGRNGTEILRTEWPSVDADDMRRRIAEMGHWRGEGTQVLKDGTRIPVEMSSIVLRNKSGQITGYISMNRDIRERKRAETALQDYNARLEEDVSTRTRELRDAQEQLVRKEKLAVLGQLAGGVGHELRNPLSVINTSIYYLKMVQPEVEGKIKEHHAIIEREVQNATKIISDLLDYSRVISSDQQAVAVVGLVRQTLERFPVPPGVKLTLKLPGDLPDVFADPFQVVQVLGNLVVNACQAMISQGSATGVKDSGRLTISTHEAAPVPGRGRKKAMVEIAVKDTGTGITPENMKSLFEPLFSTKITGIGLGLAVSKKLAEANGGGIEVESEAGKGSTFTLFLPVAGRQEK